MCVLSHFECPITWSLLELGLPPFLRLDWSVKRLISYSFFSVLLLSMTCLRRVRLSISRLEHRFDKWGRHVISVRLDSDSEESDGVRWTITRVLEDSPIPCDTLVSISIPFVYSEFVSEIEKSMLNLYKGSGVFRSSGCRGLARDLNRAPKHHDAQLPWHDEYATILLLATPYHLRRSIQSASGWLNHSTMDYSFKKTRVNRFIQESFPWTGSGLGGGTGECFNQFCQTILADLKILD